MNKGKTVNIEEIEFENEKQKQIAIVIADMIKSSGKTQKEFAEDLQISLATLTNIFRPAYNQVPSAKVIRKIADQTDTPEETYYKLMEIAHPDKFEPYNPIDLSRFRNIVDIEKSKLPNQDGSFIFKFMKEIATIAPNPEIDFTNLSNRGFPQFASVDYSTSDAPIDKWFIEFKAMSTVIYQRDVQEFFYRILKNGKKNIKYSIVTCAENALNEFMTVNANLIDSVYISVIVFKNDKFTETYLTTPHDKLDNEGLSLK